MIKSILKGAVIGIANVIPGVSGGTMAVSMGIYDKMIYSVTHLFKDFKNSVKFLLPIVIGVGIAAVGLSFIIEYLFAKCPLPTNLLFIGLIVGGLPSITKKVKGNSIGIGHILVFLIFFALVAGMAFLGDTEGASADFSMSLMSVVKLFFVGIIASATMVIPGVSGSMVLLLIGYYHPILEQINTLIRALISFDVPAILTGFAILVPFGIGVVLGIFAIAKVIEIIFAKFPLYAYWAIIGLIVASPIAILVAGELGSITFLNIVAGVITFAAGFAAAMKLGE